MISPTISEYIINETTQQFFLISPTIGEYIINLNHCSYTQEHYPCCTKILIKIKNPIICHDSSYDRQVHNQLKPQKYS
jgi:hypothetical protein